MTMTIKNVSSPRPVKPLVLFLTLALSLLLAILVVTSNPPEAASASVKNAAIISKNLVRQEEEEVNHKLHEATSRLRRDGRTLEDHYRQLAGEIDGTNATNTTTPLTPLPASATVSPFFQFETYKWTQRNILSDLELDLDTFRISLEEASRNQCEMGITATLFDADGEQILQETVGSNYHDLSSPTEPWTSGWTGETEFALYSNSKIFAAVLYMASVVETGLGYLDEPVFTTFGQEPLAGDGGLSPYVLTAANISGRITPRMILSHQTGIKAYDRNDPVGDPLYSCIANDNTTLGSCVRSYLLSDDAIATMPGSVMRYSNDPFYILAELMVLKTGASDIQELMDIYINGPLGINATYDCPLVGSTRLKPHVSWGICSSGRDVPKLIQELAITHNMIGGSIMDDSTTTSTATSTTTVSPVGILSPSSVREILNFQGEISSNADEPLPFNMPLSNCVTRTGDSEINFLMGYGLGTMITPGVKGLLFVHASTVGGYWVIAPGKYSAYFAFMKQGAFPSAYVWIARIIDKFERASTVRVRNAWDVIEVDLDGSTTTTTTTGANTTTAPTTTTTTTANFFNEITPCIDGMFIDTTTIDDAAEEWIGCPTPVL